MDSPPHQQFNTNCLSKYHADPVSLVSNAIYKPPFILVLGTWYTNYISTVGSRKKKRVCRRQALPSVEDDGDGDQGILLLHDAFEEACNEVSDEEVDIVLLPPRNSQNGDTDVEDGDEEALNYTTLDNVREVAGTLWSNPPVEDIQGPSPKLPSNRKEVGIEHSTHREHGYHIV